MSDQYQDIQNATNEELLQAFLVEQKEHPSCDTEVTQKAYIKGVEMGFKIAQPDGWRHIAPCWLRRIKCPSE